MEKLLTMKFENIRSNLEFPFILIFFISASKSIEGYLGSESLNCFNNGYDKGRTNNHIIAPKQSCPLTKYLDNFVSNKQSGKMCRYK
jgi:hypothetical protein